MQLVLAALALGLSVLWPPFAAGNLAHGNVAGSYNLGVWLKASDREPEVGSVPFAKGRVIEDKPRYFAVTRKLINLYRNLDLHIDLVDRLNGMDGCCRRGSHYIESSGPEMDLSDLRGSSTEVCDEKGKGQAFIGGKPALSGWHRDNAGTFGLNERALSFSGRLSGVSRLSEGRKDQPEAEYPDPHTNDGDLAHSAGPDRHSSLGLKIALVALGFALACYCGLRAYVQFRRGQISTVSPDLFLGFVGILFATLFGSDLILAI